MTTGPDPASRSASPWRRAARVLVTSTMALGLLGASSATAFAAPPDVNGNHSSSLGTINIILLFAVVPVAVLLVVSLIFLRPGSAPGAQRYRPGRGWNANPTWVGVPAREHADVPALEGAEVLRREADGEPAAPHEADAPVHQDPTLGGARGSW